jgi:hypothetical protein
MSLQERILTLPTAIQILISEFNVDHRPLLRKIHQEYFTIIYPCCRICFAPFDSVFCTTDYFILQKYKMDCHWCSLECFKLEQDHELKTKCLEAVHEYVDGKN